MIDATYYQKKITSLAGIDEAGRGPVAGPLVVVGVILPQFHRLDAVQDSKQLSPKKRAELFEEIQTAALKICIRVIDHEMIDAGNIYRLTQNAMTEIATELNADYTLTDAMRLETPYPHEAIIKGDQKSKTIGAASIIAKETRDRLMMDYHRQYPVYGFDRHKGYLTAYHKEQLMIHGPCAIHRFSFEPVKSMELNKTRVFRF
jgi:ribonuclease HII